MKFFDLHCDTIEELMKRGENLLNSTAQFNMRGQSRLKAAVQCMAIWVPDSIRGREAVWFVDRHEAYLRKIVEHSQGRAVLADSFSDH